MYKSLTNTTVALILGLVMFLTVLGFVVRAEPVGAAPCEPNKTFLGVPTWYRHLDGETDSFGRCSPVLDRNEDGSISLNSGLPIGLAVLEIMLRFAGLVAVVMIFVGSFRYITTQGNPENAAGARKTIINALIGLVIVMISTGLVGYIAGVIS